MAFQTNPEWSNHALPVASVYAWPTSKKCSQSPSSSVGDLVTIGRQTGRGEGGAVVADALRPDVGAVADHAAAGVGALGVLPVDPVGLAVLDAVVAEVLELVGHLHDGAEPALFERDDVRESGSGGELGEGVGTGVATGVDVGGLDGDVGVLVFVLRVQVVVPERAEGGDGQRDGFISAAIARAAGATAGQDEREGCGSRQGGGRCGAS